MMLCVFKNNNDVVTLVIVPITMPPTPATIPIELPKETTFEVDDSSSVIIKL